MEIYRTENKKRWIVDGLIDELQDYNIIFDIIEKSIHDDDVNDYLTNYLSHYFKIIVDFWSQDVEVIIYDKRGISNIYYFNYKQEDDFFEFLDFLYLVNF